MHSPAQTANDQLVEPVAARSSSSNDPGPRPSGDDQEDRLTVSDEVQPTSGASNGSPDAALSEQAPSVSSGATVRLTLLLVSGVRNTYEFLPTATVDEVRRTVYDHWPAGEPVAARACGASSEWGPAA